MPVIGLTTRTSATDALRWLTRNGDPYKLSIVDRNGRVGIDYGVYGVPETFVIDKQGIIRYKQIGPLTPEALQQKIMPLVRELQRWHEGYARACVARSARRLASVQRPVDDALDTRLKLARDELRCLVCQNQTLADCNAPLADDLRNEMRELAVAGKSDDEIRAYLVARYGDFVLYKPPVKSTTWLLWFGPFLLLAGGVIVWFVVLRRRAAMDARQSRDE